MLEALGWWVSETCDTYSSLVEVTFADVETDQPGLNQRDPMPLFPGGITFTVHIEIVYTYHPGRIENN